MLKNIELSIIIVNFNTKDLTLTCLNSLKRSKQITDNWEIIVIDNASTDGSQNEIIELQTKDKFFKTNFYFIRNAINLGFSAANNIGIRRAQGRYILLLNSDTEIIGDSIQNMIKFMDSHPKAGLSTGKLILPTGLIDPACHRGFPTPWTALTYFFGLEKLFPRSFWFARYHMGYSNMNLAHEIDSPSGAFFLIRKEIINEIGILDEDYFMYGEDIDWAYRIKQKGWQIWFNPDAQILHRKKQSGRDNKDKKIRKQTQKYFYQTMLIFYQKHYQTKYSNLLTWIIMALLKIRIILT